MMSPGSHVPVVRNTLSPNPVPSMRTKSVDGMKKLSGTVESIASAKHALLAYCVTLVPEPMTVLPARSTVVLSVDEAK